MCGYSSDERGGACDDEVEDYKAALGSGPSKEVARMNRAKTGEGEGGEGTMDDV